MAHDPDGDVLYITQTYRVKGGPIYQHAAALNAGRIIKLYGSVANKGDHTLLTPWRLSRLVSGTDWDRVVTAGQLRALHPKGNGADPKAGSAGGHLDLPAFLSRLGIAYDQDMHEGAVRYKLEHCPFNPEHGRGEAAIFQQPGGRLGFKCQHSSCADKHWQDVRALVDGPREGRASSRSEDLGRGSTSGAKAPAGDEPRSGNGVAAEGGCDGEKVTVAGSCGSSKNGFTFPTQDRSTSLLVSWRSGRESFG